MLENARKGILHWSLQRAAAWTTPDQAQWDPLWTWKVQNCKIINLCCFKSLHLWQLVVTAIEKYYVSINHQVKIPGSYMVQKSHSEKEKRSLTFIPKVFPTLPSTTLPLWVCSLQPTEASSSLWDAASLSRFPFKPLSFLKRYSSLIFISAQSSLQCFFLSCFINTQFFHWPLPFRNVHLPDLHNYLF